MYNKEVTRKTFTLPEMKIPIKEKTTLSLYMLGKSCHYELLSLILSTYVNVLKND
ncbi:hypothetical protein J2772_004893 [Chryseobacterium jejuense]|nr:hypothetical protein [Chryseobacterium jejuense]